MPSPRPNVPIFSALTHHFCVDVIMLDALDHCPIMRVYFRLVRTTLRFFQCLYLYQTSGRPRLYTRRRSSYNPRMGRSKGVSKEDVENCLVSSNLNISASTEPYEQSDPYRVNPQFSVHYLKRRRHTQPYTKAVRR
jgi:hypothetical protein